MKCAKCGNNISADAVDCPYCSGGGASEAPEVSSPQVTGDTPEGGNRDMMLRCPSCGSRRIQIFRGDYSLGWGCLGTLLFGWLGLLLGLLGLGDSEAVCMNCGYRARMNRTQAGGSGCGCLLIIIIIILIIIINR